MSKSNIIKPIIIFGTGRSGTSIFHKILSRHPNVAWLSGSLERWPTKPEYNRILMKALEAPILENLLRRRFQPDECYAFWEYYVKGFRRPFRDLTREDLTNKSKHAILSAMSELVTEERNRLLIKITGWPRLDFLSGLFEDAKFIHVIRDGRAVANSMINVTWWRGWEGPQNWRWGPLPEEYETEWNLYNKSFIVLAAIEWKMLMDAAEEGKKHLNENSILEIKYEDFCAHPIENLKFVIKFCGLDWSDYFMQRISIYQLHNTNDKYKTELTTEQQNDLNDVLKTTLKRYGYN